MMLNLLPFVAVSLLGAAQVRADFSVAVRVWQDADAKGPDRYYTFGDTGCIYTGPEWNDRISSLSVYPAGYYCTFYDNVGCNESGSSNYRHFPAGYHRYVGDNLNDRISALRCRPQPPVAQPPNGGQGGDSGPRALE